MYGAVVMFYEPMAEDECREEMRQALGVGREVSWVVSKLVQRTSLVIPSRPMEWYLLY